MSALNDYDLFDRAVESTASTLQIDDGSGDLRSLTSDELSRLKARLRQANLDVFARSFTTENPADLTRAPANIGGGGRPVYVVYSGDGAGGKADEYIGEMRTSGLKAGTISDTPFGTELTGATNRGDFQTQVDALNDEFGSKLRFRGEAIGNRSIADVLWNYGSQDYIENGKANGAGYFRGFFGANNLSPLRGFGAVEIPNLEGEKLNGESVRRNYEVGDALKQYDAFARAEGAHKYIYRDLLYIDRQMLEPILESDDFRRHVEQSKARADDLVEENEATRRNLSQEQVEKNYIRAYRSNAEKMRQYGEYAETRARLIVKAAIDLGDRAPEFVRNGLRKVEDYYSKPDGSINSTRVGVSLAAGALAVGNLWVEWDRRKDTPGAFEQYIKSAAEDATSLTSLAFVGGLMAAATTPLGPVVLFTVTAVATYAAIKNVVDYLASDEYGLDKDGYTYKVVKHVSDSLKAFEDTVKGYIQAAAAELKEVAERALEAFSGRAIEWVTEEAAGIVGEGNDILVGDDISVLIGDEQKNWLVHRSAGEVFGDKGDDVLVGWLPEYIKAGEAIGGYAYVDEEGKKGYRSAREIREAERAGDKALEEAARSGNPSAPAPKADPNALRAEQDYSLVLNGGEGNDWVISILGEKPEKADLAKTKAYLEMLKGTTYLGEDSPRGKALGDLIAAVEAKLARELQRGGAFNGATTIGGLGRDWIFNTSPNGVIYGDTEDGTYERQKRDADGALVFDVDGNPVMEKLVVQDTGANSDNIWFWADTTLMDAQHSDVLKYFGIPMTGGDANGGVAGLAIFNGLFGSAIGMANIARYLTGAANDWTGEIYVDHIQPWILYGFKRDEDGNLDMYVTNAFEQIFRGLMAGLNNDGPGETPQGIHKGWMKIENVDVVGSRLGIGQVDFTQDVLDGRSQGDLGMVFRAVNPLQALLPVINLIPGAIGQALYYSVFADALISSAAAASRFAKSMDWADEVDPLIIDLDGDGIETTSLSDSRAYFDVDGDLFAERTGWLKGDDGFLVLDGNGNARIDGIGEMFGDRSGGGFAELSQHDSNADGKITVADAIWADLQVWQDRDRDGVTDAGELKSLDQLGIVEIGLGATPLGTTTPQNARLLSSSTITFDTGRTSFIFEALFTANDVDTKFAGEAGRAPWQSNTDLNAKGFGTIADLGIAAANDPGFAKLAQDRAAAMTVPKMKDLVAKVGDVLGEWGMTLETSRELVAVELDAGGALLDRAVYVEDTTGGYWTLDSGNPILDAGGAAIARPTLEQVLSQGSAWRVEQAWSPSSRGSALTFRDEAPYLMKQVDGRAVILDYGVKQAGGRWILASDPSVSYASVDDILALGHAVGTEWRREDIQFNPLANLPVEKIGVNFLNGVAIDYTVQVTDDLGTFYVWARNLDRALQLQAKTGAAFEFNLRNYEVNFETLDEVGSTDDSVYRVELLTPQQFHFATSLGGIDFRPAMLTATYDNPTGQLAYSVNGVEGAGRYVPEVDAEGNPVLVTYSDGTTAQATTYQSDIKTMIAMIQPVMEQYVTASRRLAVRLALQGGLKPFAQGLSFDATRNVFVTTTDRQMAPMFEAIFAAAPASNADDAVFDYLTDWNELLWQIYPDFAPEDDGGVMAAKAGIDQAYIMQMLIQAFENVPVDLDIRGVAHALSVDETRIVTHAADAPVVEGTSGVDYFYMTGGDQTLGGGMGADYYFVGKNSGDDVIFDQDLGGNDELRFTEVDSDDVVAVRDGQDLILKIRGQANFVRLTDQFLGELNLYLANGKQFQSGVEQIVFSDGVIWDRFRMALEVADPRDTGDVYAGSGSADVLWGGKGNDVLTGGLGGDIYIFARGDGHDVLSERGGFSFGPLKAGIDFLKFIGDIASKDLRFTRTGTDTTLVITVIDGNGVPTGDSIEIEDYFGGISLGLGLFSGVMGDGEGLEYVSPNQIERFIFDDGTSLEFVQVAQQVLDNAKTRADNAIYGFLNNNKLDGGFGDDYLQGGKGDDTYIFGRGYGHDVIEDNGPKHGLFSPPSQDALTFIDDVRWTELDYLRTGKSDTLTLRITGTDDQVTMVDFLEELPFLGYVNAIENIVFGDGTKWSYLKLLQHFVDVGQTAGNDLAYGFEGIADVFKAGAGDDRLEGLSGNDVYYFGKGSGTDTVYDESDSDRIVFSELDFADVKVTRTAEDLVFTIIETGEKLIVEGQYIRDGGQHAAVELFVFADLQKSFTDLNPEDIALDHFTGGATNGDDIITGSNFGEWVDGRGGDDQLNGGDGGDTYVFDVGYGHDVITDRRLRANWGDRHGTNVPVNDTILFGADIRYKVDKNIVFTPSGNDLLITIVGRPDSSLRIKNQFAGIDDAIESFVFGDGTVLSAGDIEQLLQMESGNRGNNDIEVSPLLINVPNTLDGRQGNDTLTGGFAGDTYVFTAGYDFDTIHEKPDHPSAIDIVAFGASVRRDDLIVIRDGDDLVIDLGNGADVLRIVGGLASTGVEEFHFASGPPLTRNDLINRLLTGGASDENIVGFDGRHDEISGGAGSDALFGGTGNDTYRFGVGDGNDAVTDTGGIDRIVFGAGIAKEDVVFSDVDGDLLVSLGSGEDKLVILGGYKARPVESFVFANGDLLSLSDVRSLILGSRSNDGQDIVDLRELVVSEPVEPGRGNDRVVMATGGTITFNVGDGIDRIEIPSGVTDATIDFADFSAADAVIRSLGEHSVDIAVTFANGDQVILVGGMLGGALPRLAFADGQTLDGAAIAQRLVDDQASAGDDVVYGSSRAETLTGGQGADYLDGGAGSDSYVFDRGDGSDTIVDGEGTDDALRIKGYVLADLRATFTSDFSETELTFGTEGDRVTLRNTLWGNGVAYAVDRIVFDDGSFTLAQLEAIWRGQGKAGDDHLVGTAGVEVFTGGPGDDTVAGNGGADVIRFNRGDGHDRIESASGFDGLATIAFGAGIAMEDVTAKRDADGNIVLLIAGGDDRLTLIDPADDIHGIVGLLKFADGRQRSLADIALSVAPTDGDDHIIVPSDAINVGGGSGVEVFGGLGNDHIETGRGSDLITGGKGNDLLQGASGADTYYFQRGDGQDVVLDTAEAGVVDKVRFGPGIGWTDIEFLSMDAHALVIRIAGTDDRLTLRNVLPVGGGSPDYGAERFEFADQTAWTLAEILSRATAALSGWTGENPFPGGTGADLPVTGLAAVGAASVAGAGIYQLTPASDYLAGAVWGEVDLSRSTVWTTRILFGASEGGADGLSFALQNLGPNVTTEYGGGRLGALVSGSLGIAFDTYPNGGDPGEDYSQIVLGGLRGDTAFDGFHTHGQLEDGQWHDVVIAWDADRKRLSYSVDGTLIASKAHDVVGLNFGGDANAWFGFGAATGGAANDHRVELVSVRSYGEASGGEPAPETDPFDDPLFGGAGGSGGSQIRLVAEVPLSPSTTRLGHAYGYGDRYYYLTSSSPNENGAVWGEVDLSKDVVWDTSLYFSYNDASGGNGIAFALAPTTSLGADANQFGVLSGQSLGIRFDTTATGGHAGDPSGDFSQFVLHGDVTPSSTAFDPFHPHGNLENGAWRPVKIQWNAAAQELSYSLDGMQVASIHYDVRGLLLGGSSIAKFGFGAATSSVFNQQTVEIKSIYSTDAAMSVVEGASVGTLIANLRIADPAIDSAWTYQIVDSGGNPVSDGPFEIVNVNELRVRDGTVIDYETASQLEVYVRAFDPSSGSKTTRLQIAVRDVSDAGGTQGDAGDNFLQGTEGADLIQGYGGSDSLYGLEGNDELQGGEGNDYLSGGEGDDVLIPGVNAHGTDGDWLEGGSGNDTFLLDARHGSSQVVTGEGQDQICLLIPAGFDPGTVWNPWTEHLIQDFTAGEGGDVVAISFASPQAPGFDYFAADVLRLAQQGDDVVIYAATNSDELPAYIPVMRLSSVDAGDLTAANFGGIAPFLASGEITGNEHDEFIEGTEFSETIHGLGGGDVAFGNGGDDTLIGDDGVTVGVDPATTAALSDYFGPLSNTLVNGLGGTAGFGEEALEVASGGEFDIEVPAEFLSSLTDGMLIVEGQAITAITIGTNGYLYIGDLGLEIWPMSIDTEAGVSGTSDGGNSTGANRVWYDFDEAAGTITVTWDDVGDTYRPYPTAFQAQVKVLADGEFDVVFRYENIGWTEEYRHGTMPAVYHAGNEYNPPVSLRDDLSLLPGNLGTAGVWAMQLRGDALIGLPASQKDYLYGGSGDDTLMGGAGNDYLDGEEGDDTISGGDGDDVIRVRAYGGTDQATGGAGRDVYLVTWPGDYEPAGAARVSDFQAGYGGDIISLDPQFEVAYDRLDLVQEGADVVLYYSYPDGGYAPLLYLENIDRSSLTSDNFDDYDFRWPNLPQQVVVGTEDGDELTGSPFSDSIEGRGGNDILIGGSGGGDTVDGGAGDDLFDYVSSDGEGDTLTGGEGRDTYVIEIRTIENDYGETVVEELAADLVSDFAVGDGGDLIDILIPPELSGIVFAQQDGDDTRVLFIQDGADADAGQLLLTLANVTAEDLTAANFSGREFFTTLDQIIIGDGDDNELIGGPGNDQIFGA